MVLNLLQLEAYQVVVEFQLLVDLEGQEVLEHLQKQILVVVEVVSFLELLVDLVGLAYSVDILLEVEVHKEQPYLEVVE